MAPKTTSKLSTLVVGQRARLTHPVDGVYNQTTGKKTRVAQNTEIKVLNHPEQGGVLVIALSQALATNHLLFEAPNDVTVILI